MYYIVNAAGQPEGPYPKEWIRSNALPKTQVSHGQLWVAYESHPEFQSQAAQPEAIYYVVGDTGQAVGPYVAEWIRSNAQPHTKVSYGRQWIPYASHPDFHDVPVPRPAAPTRAHVDLAAQPMSWLIKRAVRYLAIGVFGATVLLMINQLVQQSSGIPTASGTWMSAWGAFTMTLTWLLVFAIALFPAFVFGKLFGARARFAVVVYGFARASATLYILLPLALILYTGAFVKIFNKNIALALLFILFQFLLLPIVCVVFGVIGIRSFVRIMVFPSAGRAWATILAALACSTLLILAASNWFAIWNEFTKWFL